jgi:hypothetical protein
LETSPRTGINASRNRPYSLNTIDLYHGYYKCHIKDDPICKLKMSEIEEEEKGKTNPVHGKNRA